jgi:hypothetical protein
MPPQTEYATAGEMILRPCQSIARPPKTRISRRSNDSQTLDTRMPKVARSTPICVNAEFRLVLSPIFTVIPIHQVIESSDGCSLDGSMAGLERMFYVTEGGKTGTNTGRLSGPLFNSPIIGRLFLDDRVSSGIFGNR